MKMMTATMTQTTMAVEAGMMMLSSRLLSPTPSVRISRHCGKGTFDGVISTLNKKKINFWTSPKAYHCNSWLIVLQRNLHWNLLKADDADNDALIVRHILDLELALAWRQGRSLLELWRPKQSGWEDFNFDAVRKSKQTCRWRENQGCLLFLIPTWSLSSFSPLHFNILFCTNNNDNKK